MNRFFSLLLVAVYVNVHRPEGDCPRVYVGVSKAQVAALLNGEGREFDFITQKEFEDYEVAHPIGAPSNKPEREAAKTILKDKSKTVTQRLNALVDYLEIQ